MTRCAALALVLVASLAMTACATVRPSGSADPLNRTSWTLSRLNGRPLLPGTLPTMHFEQGRVQGSDGCNRYSASYSAADGLIRVARDMLSTKMACPEAVMQQADAFVSMLSEARGYRIGGSQLILLAGGDTERAVFDPQAIK